MTDDYNYKAFDACHYDLGASLGSAIGEPAPDFTAHLLNGRQVKLSDYFATLTVLEMGSVPSLL